MPLRSIDPVVAEAITEIKEDIKAIKDEQHLTRAQLAQLTESITLARGGLKMLVVLGTISAALATLAIGAWNAFIGTHHP